MRSVVLDTSVLVGTALKDEPWHLAAIHLTRAVAERLVEAVVAPTFPCELRNSLVKAARRRRMSWGEVSAAITRIERLEIPVAAVTLSDGELLEACQRYGVGWADAHPALLARRLDIPLVTADLRLARALRTSGIWVESILDRPADAEAPG